MEVREPNARYLVKPAFKQTEVGVIPEDWNCKNFECLYSEPSRNGIYKASEFHGTGTRIVNMGEMFGFEFISDQEMSRVLLTARELSVGGLHDGDLLFGRRSVVPSGAGKCSLVVSPIEPITFESSIIRVRLDRAKANPGFYYYFFTSPIGRSTVGTIISGTNVKGIRATELRGLPVPLPVLAEQQAIAEALSDADALIEALEQLLAKKRRIKQGAMQELLTGQKRLPGFEQKSRYKQTDLGSVPEDWDVIPIGQAAQCLIGLTYSPNDVRSFGTLVLRSSNVQNGCLAFDDNVYVEMELPARVITQEDDILICVRNGSRQLIGKCALIDEAAAGSAFGAFMAVLRSKSSRFLFQQFQSHILKRQISDVMGATINQITNKDMAAFQVIWPVLESEQTAIATVLSDLDAELAALETKLAKARQLKQGMMQELLTGRIRLV